VRGINSTLRVHRTEKSRVELGELFGLGAYSSDVSLREDRNRFEITKEEDNYDHVSQHDGESHDQVHSDISTILIPVPPLSTTQYDRLNSFLETLLWEGKLPPPSTSPAPEILRTKGYITMHDGRSFILQGVTDLFELKELPRDDTDSRVEGGKVVFIGRGVDAKLSMTLNKYMGLDA